MRTAVLQHGWLYMWTLFADQLLLDEAELPDPTVMNVSVSCDHRVIDGYDAASMMQDFKALIEDPVLCF